jgi:hypothetical protein
VSTAPSGSVPGPDDLVAAHTKAELLELAERDGVETKSGWTKSEIAAAIVAGSQPDKADAGWHPVARQWFESLAQSGQSAFYQPSDWATARVIAESISRELKPQPMVVGFGEDAHVEWIERPPKGASMAAWLKGMTVLLVTEGDRRRAQVELERPRPAAGDEEPTADVSELDEYRRRLRGG